MHTHSSRSSMAVRVFAPVLLLLVLAGAALAEPLPLPGATGWQVWRADQAQQHGAWQAGVPDADGTRYLQPSGTGEAWLDFTFRAEEPVTLQVRPEWWRTGAQKSARRFPYPLVRQFGPTALAAVGTEVFALAPAAGRVIVIDAASEKPVAVIDVGGYLTDMVADPDKGLIVLADAQGSRLVAIDCSSRKVVGSLAVPGRPWSLALLDGKVYVACREGKRVVAFDATSGDQVGEATFDLSPVSLEVAGSPARVVVRFEDQVYDPLRLAALTPDQVQYPVPSGLPSKPEPPCGGPDCGCTWVEFTSPLAMDLVTNKGRKSVSLAAPITKMSPPPGFTAADLKYTSVFLEAEKKRHIFFTVPSAGEVWEITGDGVVPDPIAIGGTPSGLCMDASAAKLYIADPAGDRISVLDVASRKVERTLKVSGHPTSLAVVKQLAWQREEIRPPIQVNRLYAVCTEPSSLAAIDLGSGKEVKRLPLAVEASAVQFVPMPNPGWWPELADDRVPLALQPKLAVAARPVLLDPQTLGVAAAPDSIPALAPSRSTLALAAGGQTKTFATQDDLLVRVDGKRFIDVSAMADPQRLAAQPLGGGDTPGTITVSLDGGPEYDWSKGVWVAPESKMLQVNGSDEFWRHNATTFAMPAGEHVLRVRAHDAYGRLAGVALRRAPESQLTLSLVPEPRARHAQVPLPSYRGLFYDQEPVQFTLEISNAGAATADLALSHELRNYLGTVVASAAPAIVSVPAGRTITQRLDFAPADTGRFTLTVVAASPQGEERTEARFVRVPKLEHPRLFWRKEDEAAIRDRIARHPNLFRRYAEWLERNVTKEGNFPERFLPPGLTRQACESAAPASMANDPAKGEACGWRMYELGWRILATEFAGLYLKPKSPVLQQKIAWLRSQEKTDSYTQNHHHGPFFPGAEATVVDLAPDSTRESLPLWKQFRGDQGQMNTPSWTLATIEPPLDPMERAMLYEFATWMNNAERYFETHRGSRGGLWWSDPYTGCHCPMQGYAIEFMLARNVLGEPRLFEKPIFRGYFTFQRYADPIQDNKGLQPNRRNPNGEPWRWITTSLSRHPVEKSSYDWEGWVQAMDGPTNDETAEVDRLMSLQGRPFTMPLLEGYTTGGATNFVSGVAVPIALALGWYEPEAEEVKLEDTPTSAVFDGEGWATMRSGWDKDATEVTFISGVRDHTTRHKPNHLTIAKGGEYLLGTPALWGDDGNNVAIWSNSVVVDGEWEDQWTMNLVPPRHGEHIIIDRFSPAAWTYLARDRVLTPYQPAERGWGAGLNLHGHTESLFMQEGNLLAYQTWPELDYAAGDASNAWPVEKVSQIDRQVVFVKPDVVIVYDRVKLGPEGHSTRWLAAVGPEVRINGQTFRIRSGAASLQGRVVLPRVTLTTTAPKDENGWVWKGQQRLEARPTSREPEPMTEYLVVMRVGGEDAPMPAPQVSLSGGRTGVKLAAGSRTIEVQFYRTAAAGGEVTVSDAAGARKYQLHQGIDDSYANWSSDPLYRRWSSEARFDFVVANGK